MTQESNLIWQGPAWRLMSETAVLPDGRIMSISAIRHPGAVVIIPIQKQADQWQLLLINQYRPVINQTIVELPAGTLAWGEEWLPAAQRELREETGFRAEQLTYLGEFWPVPGSSDECMHFYLAEGLTPDPLPQDEDEQIEPFWLPLQQAIKMALNGEIKDGKTIIGLIKSATYLKMITLP